MTPAPGHISYDELHYVGNAYAQTHPERLAALGRLHGMQPAPVERCRVLEIACGDGNNLLPMAYALPGSTFLGIDLAAGPLAAGRDQAAKLGLTNLRLEALDLMEFPADAGPFDYVIAHGLYSWCPAVVRDRLMALCGELLAPQGMAFISFNAYPGYHIGDLQRQLMLYHLSHTTARTATERAKQALSVLDFVARAQPENSAYHLTLKQAREFYTERISQGGDAGLAWFNHDLLSVDNHAVYFHEFMAHAGRHGLQFVSEAQPRVLRMMDLPADTIQVLSGLQGDPLAVEQYLDFVLCIPFRQVVLCRGEVPLNRRYGPAAMQGLTLAGEITSESGEGEGGDATDPNAPETFSRPSMGKLTVTHPDAKATLRRIGAAWPDAVAFTELAGAVSSAITPEDLSELLLRLGVGTFVTFRTRTGVSARTAREQPEGSAVARLQAEAGFLVTNLYHQTVSLEPRTRFALRQLDGQRSRAGCVDALRAWIVSGKAAREYAELSGAEAKDVPGLEGLGATLDQTLQSLAKLGLLMP